jgi:hypothetical protein
MQSLSQMTLHMMDPSAYARGNKTQGSGSSGGLEIRPLDPSQSSTTLSSTSGAGSSAPASAADPKKPSDFDPKLSGNTMIAILMLQDSQSASDTKSASNDQSEMRTEVGLVNGTDDAESKDKATQAAKDALKALREFVDQLAKSLEEDKSKKPDAPSKDAPKANPEFKVGIGTVYDQDDKAKADAIAQDSLKFLRDLADRMAKSLEPQTDAAKKPAASAAA